MDSLLKKNKLHKFKIEGTVYVYYEGQICEIEDKADEYVIDKIIELNSDRHYSKKRLVKHLLGKESDAALSETMISKINKIWDMLDINNEMEIEYKKDLFNAKQSYCINVANICNMKCSYCWNIGGGYNMVNENESNKLMQLGVAYKIADYIIAFKDTKSKSDEKDELLLYGGEPLLNWEVVKYLVDKLHKYCSINLNTNGILLTDNMYTWLTERQVIIIISLDGPPQIQNSQRPMLNGDDSYEKIVRNIKDIIMKSKGIVPNIHLRSTLYPLNKETMREVFEFYKNVFPEIENNSASIVYAQPRSYNGKCLYEFDVNKYKEGKIKYLLFLLENANKYGDDFIVKYFNNLFFHNIPRMHIGCAGLYNGLAFETNGDIYPCLMFFGNSNYKLGSVDAINETTVKNGIAEFRNKLLTDKNYIPSQCSECWLLYHCGGIGCYAQNAQCGENMYIPDPLQCEIIKAETELKIWFTIKIKHKYPVLYQKIIDQNITNKNTICSEV